LLEYLWKIISLIIFTAFFFNGNNSPKILIASFSNLSIFMSSRNLKTSWSRRNRHLYIHVVSKMYFVATFSLSETIPNWNYLTVNLSCHSTYQINMILYCRKSRLERNEIPPFFKGGLGHLALRHAAAAHLFDDTEDICQFTRILMWLA